MDFAAFVDVTAQNASAFFDLNALAHESVFTALLAGGIVTAHYPMFTENPDTDWLYIHYQEHLEWSARLALPLPPDLSNVDLNDEQAFQAWLYKHALHHKLVALQLNL